LVGVVLAGWRPVPAWAAVRHAGPAGRITAPGWLTVPAIAGRIRATLHSGPRADVPLQIDSRRTGPGRRLAVTAVVLPVLAVRQPTATLIPAGLKVRVLAGPRLAADLGGLPAARVPIGRGQRVGPDTLAAELTEPVVGVVCMVAPVVRGRAIITPPAHRYLHDPAPARPSAQQPAPQAAPGLPPLLVKGPMRAEAPQPAWATGCGPASDRVS
jgi:hypothetical protein